MTGNGALLEVRDLRTLYSVRGSFLERLRGREAGAVKAVDGVSFDLRGGEVLGRRRRVRVRQDDARAHAAGLVEASDGSIEFEGNELVGLSETELPPLPPPAADRVPGPARVAEPGDDDRRRRRRPAAVPRDRERPQGDRAEWSRRRWSASASPRPISSCRSTRATSPGGQKQRASLARAIILAADDPDRRRAGVDARHERAGQDPRADARAEATSST